MQLHSRGEASLRSGIGNHKGEQGAGRQDVGAQVAILMTVMRVRVAQMRVTMMRMGTLPQTMAVMEETLIQRVEVMTMMMREMRAAMEEAAVILGVRVVAEAKMTAAARRSLSWCGTTPATLKDAR